MLCNVIQQANSLAALYHSHFEHLIKHVHLKRAIIIRAENTKKNLTDKKIKCIFVFEWLYNIRVLSSINTQHRIRM